MNSSTSAGAVPSSEKDPPVPRTFLLAVFAASILVGAVVMYFGVTGHLGSGIP